MKRLGLWSRTRRGFTLVELLVVIAIMASRASPNGSVICKY